MIVMGKCDNTHSMKYCGMCYLALWKNKYNVTGKHKHNVFHTEFVTMLVYNLLSISDCLFLIRRFVP